VTDRERRGEFGLLFDFSLSGYQARRLLHVASMKKALLLASAMIAVAASLACQAQPRQRPLDVGPVASGPGTIEYERRRLQGTWGLDQFQVVDAKGNPFVVKAQATLTYDEYGNLSVRGKLLEPLPGEKFIEQPQLEYEGPIVIDAQKHEFRLGAVKTTQALEPGLEDNIGSSNLRRYELTDTTLRITYLNRSGSTTAIASFTRKP
jgi:hypothetical protein